MQMWTIFIGFIILIINELPQTFQSLSLQSMFFFLAQTEQGDIFKITLETDEDMVTEVRMKYFDTVPIATSMNVLKTGFLFLAAEFGNQWVQSCLNIFVILIINPKSVLY